MSTKQQSFYDLASQDQIYKAIISASSPKTIENYDKIQKLLKLTLRPYQLEALSAFQLFWRDGFDSRSLKEQTLQHGSDDQDEVHKWYKFGFEMATGSGKTLLMGATILDLYQRGFRDFLILTPNTILFDKTIENFTPRTMKSIFGDGWNLSYNLVTGNSYRDKTCNYEEGRDISFYVFNMQKFYDKSTSSDQDTMKGVPYIRRPLEDSLWRDKSGKNTIPFVDFLKERNPVIISDEAHHYQQKKTSEAIFELLPSAVVEFTATSIEKGGSESFGQDNLYKYPMQRYIKEGYGKRIFAVGCGTSGDQHLDEVSESDKQKLVWGMLIHLLKRESLSVVNAPVKKAMLLTKARSIKHADALDKYLKAWPDVVANEFSDVIEQVQRESTDIAKIIRQHILGDNEKLLRNLSDLAKSIFTIHSENKSDDDVWTDYKALEYNDAEIVNQVRMFNEGVDYDNFYTIVILGDTNESGKVKKASLVAAQLIGRGLRLYKENREFDVLDHELKEQSEILHIVCDRGKHFDKFVAEVQSQMKLDEGTIETPAEEEDRENPVNKNIIDDYEIPILRIKPISTGKTFEQIIRDKSMSAEIFINEVCGLSDGDKVLKDEVLAMIDYVEITDGQIAQQKEKPATTRRTITLSENDIARWSLDFIEQTGAFIGNNSFNTVQILIGAIIDAGIQVDTAYASDYKRALRALKKSIIAFYGEKSFELMFRSEFTFRKKNVKTIFIDEKVTVRKREGWVNLIPSYQEMTLHESQKGILVEGYKHSIRPYIKLDSRPEKWVADALENICSLDKTGKSFWVRNQPRVEYPVEVKPAPFYPDFLAFIDGQWAIIDVKGKHLAESKKIDERKNALKLLDKKGGVFAYFLIDGVMETKGFNAEKIKKITDLEGYDALRHVEFSSDQYTAPNQKTIFNE